MEVIHFLLFFVTHYVYHNSKTAPFPFQQPPTVLVWTVAKIEDSIGNLGIKK